MAADCAPFEDYEYIIFGNDRNYFVGIDSLMTIVWLPTVLRIKQSGLQLFLLSISLPILLLAPIRIVKVLHIVLDPARVEDSWVYCWYLRLEYLFHYWISYIFLTSVVFYLILVIKNKSPCFPIENSHRGGFILLLMESFIRAILSEFFDSYLWYLPSIYHIWLQIFLNTLWTILMMILPCRAYKRETKDEKGWSICWLLLYLTFPYVLSCYQSSILLPRHGVAGYEATKEEQDSYWYSVEAYLAHKFTFNIISILGPIALLPPIRRVYFKQRDPVTEHLAVEKND